MRARRKAKTNRVALLLGSVAIMACGDPALAQRATNGTAAPPPAAPEPEIVVTGRLRGSVAEQVPQAPIATFDEADIASYGVSSIADLLDAISPETNSGRGRGAGGPIILVNGVRIASFRELRDYPPEAIKRIEVLPEEVSLRYGFPPDQRVVNVILKDHFAAKTLEAEFTEPDIGGTQTDSLEASLATINLGRRLNVTLRDTSTSPLTEAKRGVAQAPGSVPTAGQANGAPDPNPAFYRDLVPASTSPSLNATWTLPVGEGAHSGTLALNLALTRADSINLSGLSTLCGGATPGPCLAGEAVHTFLPALSTFTRTDTVQSGAALNKPVGRWQLSATIDGTHAYTQTRTDQPASVAAMQAALGDESLIAPPAVAHTVAISNSLTSLVTMIGHPLTLPGGETSLTLKAGYAWSDQVSTNALVIPAQVTLRRGDASAGLNLAVPITSRRTGFGQKLGDITLNTSAGFDHVSDLSQNGGGWLTNWSAGVTWGLTEALNLQVSWINTQAAPSLGNLGNPLVTTFNVPIYDFATGQTVLATTLTGGNPALAKEAEHDLKLGLNWSLPLHGAFSNSNLIVEFFDNHSANVTNAFPLLTPQIEAAYPGRVVRNAAGTITEVVETPITLLSQHEQRLRWGFNLFGNLGRPLPPTRDGRFGGLSGGGLGGGPPPRGFGGGSPDGPPPGFGGRGPGGPGGFGGRPGGDGRDGQGRRQRYPGRWNLAVYHTVQFIDRVQLAPGLAPLNLLDGQALSNGGGVARHTIEVDGGTFYKGFGLRLAGMWTGPTHVDPLGAPLSSDLRFGALANFRLRAFVDFQQQARFIKAVPFLKGARMSLLVNNIFDQRTQVTNGAGQTPIAYQPYLVDPLGRTLGVEFRKLF